jgi:AcrR family transcriptional regulator
VATGLRARKKRRTRETIVRVAVELFAERGYQATTLVEIADAAEIAPSTLHTYFPSKADIVFALFDAVIESARQYVVDRPGRESSAVDAVLAWVKEELPTVEAPYVEALRLIPRLVDAEPELEAEQRLRRARLEDVLAEAFARDLDEPADHLRARVMATIAMRGMLEVWEAWYRRHADDADFDVGDLFDLKTAYLERALQAGAAAIEQLPSSE